MLSTPNRITWLEFKNCLAQNKENLIYSYYNEGKLVSPTSVFYNTRWHTTPLSVAIKEENVAALVILKKIFNLTASDLNIWYGQACLLTQLRNPEVIVAIKVIFDLTKENLFIDEFGVDYNPFISLMKRELETRSLYFLIFDISNTDFERVMKYEGGVTYERYLRDHDMWNI